MTQQLPRRDVDAGEDRRIDVERPLPGREFARGALHREDAEIDDDAGFFGDRDEFAGLEAPEARMIPAQQRFEARDGAVLQPHDRLEEDFHLVAVERAAQIGFERQTVGAQRAHRRPEHFDAVAAEALAMAHGDFGILQHVLALGDAIAGRRARRRSRR